MSDLSNYSDDELFAAAGMSGGGSALGSMSDDELYRIAGIDPARPQQPSFVRQLGSNYLQGITEAPSALWNTAKDAASFAASPIETVKDAGTVKTARTVGGLAAGTAGALAGGQAGAALGVMGGPLAWATVPIGGVLGAGFGGAAGYFGFNQAADVAETGDVSQAIPTRQDALDLARMSGTGTALGVAGKATGAAAKGTTGAIRGIGRAADGAAESFAQDALGVKPSNIAASTKRGVEFLDENGAPVAAENAVSFQSRLEQRVNSIRQSPLWDEMSSNPEKARIKVDAEIGKLNSAKNAIAGEVDAALTPQPQTVTTPGAALYPELKGKWWPSADAEAPATVTTQSAPRVKLSPDWSYAEDFIKSGKGTAGQKVKAALQAELDDIKAEWAGKDGTFKDLVSFKGETSTGKVFPNGPTATASVALREKILLGIKKAAEETADATLGPQRAGEFQATNSAISDLLTIKDLLGTKRASAPSAVSRIGKSLGSLKNLGYGAFAAAGFPTTAGLGVAARALSAGYPVATSNALTAGGSLARALGNVSGRVTGPVAALTEAATPVAIGASPGSALRTDTQTPPAAQEERSSVKSSTSNPTPLTKALASKPEVQAALQTASPLVRAMAKVESNFDPRARSSAGALGLMQLMPENIKAFGVSDPFDPEQSVKAGTALVQEEINRFGSVELALMAYHAGSPEVSAAIKKAGSSDPEKVEKFLGPKTRQYWRKVLSSVG